MREQIVENILNGMSIPFFLTMLIMCLAGVLVFFLTDVIEGVRKDRSTPQQFSWHYLAKGTLRLLVGLIVLVVSIVYFGELSKMVFQIKEPLAMNGLVAFFLGMGVDTIVKKVVKFGKETKILIRNNLK